LGGRRGPAPAERERASGGGQGRGPPQGEGEGEGEGEGDVWSGLGAIHYDTPDEPPRAADMLIFTPVSPQALAL